MSKWNKDVSQFFSFCELKERLLYDCKILKYILGKKLVN